MLNKLCKCICEILFLMYLARVLWIPLWRAIFQSVITDVTTLKSWIFIVLCDLKGFSLCSRSNESELQTVSAKHLWAADPKQTVQTCVVKSNPLTSSYSSSSSSSSSCFFIINDGKWMHHKRVKRQTGYLDAVQLTLIFNNTLTPVA